MDANVRNIRGGAQVDRGGAIAYRLGKKKGYLSPGDNLMSIPQAREIRDAFHHQNVDFNGEPLGKPVTNGQAWKIAGWVDFVWPEPEDEFPVPEPKAKR